MVDQPRGSGWPVPADRSGRTRPVPRHARASRRSGRGGWLAWAFVAGLVLFGQQFYVIVLGENPAFQTWSTIFVAIVLQAMPFLGLGVLLSGLLTAFVPDRVLSRAVPARAALAVPVAGISGAALPGCECGSVPLAGRLVMRGVDPAAALTFMLSSPAINPVVLVATAVAFPQLPMMVLARFAASLGTAVVAGFLWQWLGKPDVLRPTGHAHVEGATRFERFHLTVQYDFLRAGGFLVIGAAFSATFNVVLDPSWSLAVAGVPVLSVLVLAGLAVVLAVCSEADAFVAASLSGFSPTAKLVFLVVGPVVDLKLLAMQAGTFGPRFVQRFAPLVLGTAVLLASVVGGVLL